MRTDYSNKNRENMIKTEFSFNSYSQTGEI